MYSATFLRRSTLALQSSLRLARRSINTSTKTMAPAVFGKIGFIGVGVMAQAMIDPMIRTGLQPAEQITVYDVSTAALASISASHPNICIAQNLQQVVDDADLVVCAVKPQNLGPEFFASMNPPAKTTLLSVIAGKPMSVYLKSPDNGNSTTNNNNTGGGCFTKVARSMPNTPAQIGKGMTVWCCTPNIETEERDKITQILSSFGKQIYVDDEDFIDISTSISGSGPAYVFMLMEAMIDAGVHMGFSRKTATTLVHETILGSTLYAIETGEHPVILRNSVTSPAGTTASAIYELENGKFRTVIKNAIWACYRRSLEMGDKDSNVGPGRVHRQEIVIVPKGEAHFEGVIQGKGTSAGSNEKQ